MAKCCYILWVFFPPFSTHTFREPVLDSYITYTVDDKSDLTIEKKKQKQKQNDGKQHVRRVNVKTSPGRFIRSGLKLSVWMGSYEPVVL